MAAILPVLSALSAAAGVASTVAGGLASQRQAEIQESQARLQGRVAEVNARMQAVATNEALLKTLSRNNAVAAASGIQSTGSVAAAQDAAQRKANEELSVIGFNAEMQQTALTAKAESASSAGKNALAGSLFDTVTTGAGFYKNYRRTK